MKIRNRYGIALLAATPYLLLQLLFISDIDGWSYQFAYGVYYLALLLAFVMWAIILYIERKKRRALPEGEYRLPWFSFAGAIFLLLFFQFAGLMKSFVLEQPDWCRITQTIRWKTEKPNTKYIGNYSYVLVLIGRGNKLNHEFVGAYLNWSGNEAAGFSSIDIENKRFAFSSSCGAEDFPATYELLHQRIQNAGLSPENTEAIASDIWVIINQAYEGKQISVSNAEIEDYWVTPSNNQEVKLGAAIWMLLLIVVFEVIGTLSIPKRKNAEQNA